ncbi:tRNA (adenosine(37)-N6)-threonylcarbamoyltransferase complex ATPase subunit type 1 TsaE [Thiocapsa sp.]|uniref:tRNA (adenosine(37)-N6)-threonylcarbamoyltransferase complex ATPase subunit type 1 TsaE n=1 Tax=Thiocapsa sp. TaxID=2024551 RepID=UPI002C2793A6|nr:tRNA (adenosine(37)-N6)-threonylcarbamoyltransferase complex ATPase subunit type 1 TsaE [Thiocapsa sp.]HSO82134.1 tRNA (adenosine(37)-N6)-threonylcarbamoyltransferase complex ATPase subunit type 1 TsaE [Thiocapsa sp.]
MIEHWLPDPEAQLAFGARLAALLPPRLIVYLEGDLGTGKTTLTRGVLAGLGHRGAARSPTYTLLEPYELADRRINHLDLYRLGDPQELEYLGLRDLLAEDAVWMVEWPERGLGMLPLPDLVIAIEYAANGRHLRLSARTPAGEAVLGVLAGLGSGDSARCASPEKSDVIQ